MSVGTNKAIAVLGGAEGVALSGLYRGLANFILSVVTCGSNILILQKVSASQSDDERGTYISAAGLLLLMQGLVIFTAAILAPAILARWLFGFDGLKGQLLEVRIVLGMAFLNLLLQTLTAIVKGQPDMRPVVSLQITSAAASLLLIFPLLQLGPVGLALNVGSGSLAGTILALFFVFRIFRPKLHMHSLGNSLKLLSGVGASSLGLIAHSLGLGAGLLTLQSIVNRHYGLAALGSYTASMLILDTVAMVLMSSTRTYLLPALGRLLDEEERERLFTRSLTILLTANTAASVILILGSKFALQLLFSDELAVGADFLAALGISLIGLSFAWSYNTYLLHKGEYRLFVALDIAWMACLLGATGIALQHDLSLIWIAWIHSASCLACGIAYACAVRIRFGSALASTNVAIQGMVSLLVVLSAYGASHLLFRGGLW